MKKLIIIASLILLSGCGRVDGLVNSFKSYTGNLDRTVTLYTANGEVIKSWETNNEILYSGPVAAFIDKKGMNVRVSGTFVIEGK